MCVCVHASACQSPSPTRISYIRVVSIFAFVFFFLEKKQSGEFFRSGVYRLVDELDSLL